MKRWQIKTTDMRTGDMLSTIEMPDLSMLSRYGYSHDLGYRYETCYFPSSGDSNVLRRYNTLSEAEAGHNALLKDLFGEKAQHGTVVGWN